MVSESTFKIPVQVCPVDDVLLELGISRVDFISWVEGPVVGFKGCRCYAVPAGILWKSDIAELGIGFDTAVPGTVWLNCGGSFADTRPWT